MPNNWDDQRYGIEPTHLPVEQAVKPDTTATWIFILWAWCLLNSIAVIVLALT